MRNLGNITTPKLFNRAYAGPKARILEYIADVKDAIRYVTQLPTEQSYDSGWTSQTKLDLLHDTRQAFGRTTLVLQGGAMFGLCHLGVVKALHLRGLLPRIITGTATGALIAALVGIHTEDELLDFLNGDGIDLTAFARHNHEVAGGEEREALVTKGAVGILETSLRRLRRFIRTGYFLDANVLEECVRANVGELTFEEAYARTKRVLNITVATSGRGGVPNLLNYLTAPNVVSNTSYPLRTSADRTRLIWSAALASNASTTVHYRPNSLLCKDETGAIVPWLAVPSPQGQITFQHWKTASYSLNERESPLSRLAELFNVNHFIVSQARPYIAPFLRNDQQHPDNPRQARRRSVFGFLTRLMTQEIHHRLSQMDSLGVLPTPIRRLLVDETIPGAGLTLVPDLAPSDFLKLLETPTKESIEYWILHGERSVWPAVSALQTRCTIEIELDRCYQVIRRRKPMDSVTPQRARSDVGSVHSKKRARAASVGQWWEQQ